MMGEAHEPGPEDGILGTYILQAAKLMDLAAADRDPDSLTIYFNDEHEQIELVDDEDGLIASMTY